MMTNEEAIKRITEFGVYHAIGDLPHSAKTVEAFKMAIEALKQPESRTGKWIPVTPETLPDLNSVVVARGKEGTWDYGTYRGYDFTINSWIWKNKSYKRVYWWMYKADALPEPPKEDDK